MSTALLPVLVMMDIASPHDCMHRPVDPAAGKQRCALDGALSRLYGLQRDMGITNSDAGKVSNVWTSVGLL